jgi:hypothetical protein
MMVAFGRIDFRGVGRARARGQQGDNSYWFVAVDRVIFPRLPRFEASATGSNSRVSTPNFDFCENSETSPRLWRAAHPNPGREYRVEHGKYNFQKGGRIAVTDAS